MTVEEVIELRGKFEWRARAVDEPLIVEGIAREATMGLGGWWVVWYARGYPEGFWTRSERGLRELTPIDDSAKAILDFVREDVAQNGAR